MHPDPRKIAPVVLAVVIIGGGLWWFFSNRASSANGLTASGTIEAVEIVVAPELGGRVTAVTAEEGDRVTAGQTLITLDDTLLKAQRAQAEAAAEAANNAALAAAASLDLLKSGPTPAQLAVAQTVIDKAQVAVDALQGQYDDLADAAKESSSGKTLKQNLDTAVATLANAQAQYDLVKIGASDGQIAVAQAQADAAQAQADAAQAALGVFDVQIGKLTITAPADGTVLSRGVEPGEVVLPGAAMMVTADLARLQITVYVPEALYGTIALDQTTAVKVDSYPGETFTATVQRIADKAEFTPRNVQTASGRKTTVYAVTLSLNNPGGKLKPGMPADVSFGKAGN
ncbi:MAG: efflux RND transporter periplasmic adaptor subunit [Chloroflexota bacterium]